MAVKSAAGVVAGQRYWNGGWVPAAGYQNGFAYAGTNAKRWYPYILKFTAPEFTGVSLKADITLYAGEEAGASPTLRWALCTSDENMEMYRDTNSPVADPTQLTSGIVTMENIDANNYQTISVSCSGIRPGGTYYLYLWGWSDPSDPQWISVYTADKHRVAVYSVAGAVRAKVVGAVRSCLVVVKHKGKLKTCMVGTIRGGTFRPGS